MSDKMHVNRCNTFFAIVGQTDVHDGSKSPSSAQAKNGQFFLFLIYDEHFCLCITFVFWA